MHRKFNLQSICLLFFISTVFHYTLSQSVDEVSVTPVVENQLLNLAHVEDPDLYDISFVVPVRSENVIFLKTCLRSLFDVISHEKSSLKFQTLILEIGHLPTTSKIYERKVGIQTVIEQFPDTNTVLVESEDHKGWPTLSEALNALTLGHNDNLIDHIRGSAMMILHEKMEILPGFFESETTRESAVEKLIAGARAHAEANFGIVGTKVIKMDNTIHHAGISFSMTKLPKPPSTRRSGGNKRNKYASIEEAGKDEEKNVAMPYYSYQGYSATDSRVSIEREVKAVSLYGMLIHSSLYRNLGGLNTTLTENYASVDLCLRAGKHKKIIFGAKSASIIYGDSGDSFSNKDELRSFSDVWSSELTKEIEGGYEIKNLTLVWSMECGKGQVLGFTTEALGFMSGLVNRLQVKVEITNMNSCKDDMEAIGLPASKIQLLERLQDTKITHESVFVVHRDPGRYNFFIDGFQGNPVYVIGRSMFESDRIPGKWVHKCNDVVNKVWVPTQFNVETFQRGGVMEHKLDKLPESIDVHTYDPDVTIPMKLPKKKSFNFLSVMKFEPRKGWDLLLDAYFSEFSSKESVSLYIRSNIDENNMRKYEAFVTDFLNKTQRKMEDLPQIVLLREQIPYTQLPSLYKAVDSVVLATHGEGWGLPLIEGMAMELPVISTNWSGNTEFMRPDNSYLVPVEELVAATEPDHLWAKVSVPELRNAMRTVFSNREEAKKKGIKARAHVVEHYSQEKVADLIIEKLRKLEDALPVLIEERRLKQEQSSAPPASNFQNSNSASTKKEGDDKVKIKIIDDTNK